MLLVCLWNTRSREVEMQDRNVERMQSADICFRCLLALKPVLHKVQPSLILFFQSVNFFIPCLTIYILNYLFSATFPDAPCSFDKHRASLTSVCCILSDVPSFTERTGTNWNVRSADDRVLLPWIAEQENKDSEDKKDNKNNENNDDEAETMRRDRGTLTDSQRLSRSWQRQWKQTRRERLKQTPV